MLGTMLSKCVLACDMSFSVWACVVFTQQCTLLLLCASKVVRPCYLMTHGHDTILGKHQPSFLFEKLWDRHKLLVIQIGCDRQDMTNRIHNSDTICPHSQLSIALCRLRGFCLSLSCTQKRGTFWCGRAAKDRSCYRRQLVLQTVSRRCGR